MASSLPGDILPKEALHGLFVDLHSFGTSGFGTNPVGTNPVLSNHRDYGYSQNSRYKGVP